MKYLTLLLLFFSPELLAYDDWDIGGQSFEGTKSLAFLWLAIAWNAGIFAIIAIYTYFKD